MGIIRESLNFERGLEPRSSMKVGKSYLDQKIIDETDWAIDIEKHSFLYDIIDLIRDYRGYPILILKNKQQEVSWSYRAISKKGVFGDYQPTPEKALINLQKSIDTEIQKENDSHEIWKTSLKTNEAQNFERGMDPKNSMQIGLQFKKQLVEKMQGSYDRGYSSQNEEHWGFTPKLWHATIQKILYPTTKIEITDQYILINAPSFTYRNFRIIYESLNFISGGSGDSNWSIKGVEWNTLPHIGKLTFANSKATNESINFERGMDPKRAMKIGEEKLIDEIDWDVNIRHTDFNKPTEVIKFIRDYKGYPVIVVKFYHEVEKKDMYIGVSISNLGRTQFAKTPKIAERDIKRTIDNILHRHRQDESLNFERGMDPKRALSLGKFSGSKKEVEEKILKLMNEIVSDPSWEGDLNYIDSVIIDKWTDGSWNIEIGTPHHFTQFGKEIKKILKEIGIETFGRIDTFVRGDYRYYQLPIKPLPITESLDFERGMEPKKSMGIGLTAVEKKIIEVTDWSENLEGVLQVADIIKIIPDFRGFPIVILKLQPSNFAVGQEPYLGISPITRTDLVETEEIAVHDAKIDIENHYIRERDKKILYP